MAFLTLYVGVRMLMLRIKAVREEKLNMSYFLLNQGGIRPEYLIKTEQHYENLFELPVLFYVVVALVVVMGGVDYWYVLLSWLYFVSRMVHASIHLTYNNLIHRRYAFFVSTAALYFMWGKLFVELTAS